MIILMLFQIILIYILYKLFAIAWSIYYKLKINFLLDSINTKEDLLYIPYKDFVKIIAEVFKRKGYKVEFTNKCGEESNGLILNDKHYVEVWKYSLNHLMDVEASMKLANCMYVNSIFRGMIISLGDFKQMTKSFCHKNVIECVNGNQLLLMCKEVQKGKEAYQIG